MGTFWFLAAVVVISFFVWALLALGKQVKSTFTYYTEDPYEA